MTLQDGGFGRERETWRERERKREREREREREKHGKPPFSQANQGKHYTTTRRVFTTRSSSKNSYSSLGMYIRFVVTTSIVFVDWITQHHPDTGPLCLCFPLFDGSTFSSLVLTRTTFGVDSHCFVSFCARALPKPERGERIPF